MYLLSVVNQCSLYEYHILEKPQVLCISSELTIDAHFILFLHNLASSLTPVDARES